MKRAEFSQIEKIILGIAAVSIMIIVAVIAIGKLDVLTRAAEAWISTPPTT